MLCQMFADFAHAESGTYSACGDRLIYWLIYLFCLLLLCFSFCVFLCWLPIGEIKLIMLHSWNWGCSDAFHLITPTAFFATRWHLSGEILIRCVYVLLLEKNNRMRISASILVSSVCLFVTSISVDYLVSKYKKIRNYTLLSFCCNKC